MALAAKVGRLDRFKDLNLIHNYAQTYGQHPDEVYKTVPFDTVMELSIMWKEQNEYEERRRNIEEMMRNSTATK